MSTIQSLLKWATQALASSQNPQRDAQLLLQHALACDQVTLYSWPGKTVEKPQIQTFQDYVERRAKGEPIAYITGQQAFWTIDLKMNPTTLIPRAETEGLVETLLDKVTTEQANILELGTGSGAIAIALAKEKPQWHITATDSREAVLDLAQENADRNQVKNIEFKLGSWFEALDLETTKTAFQAIVSNPPYIAKGDPHLSLGDLRFEPKVALVSGETGLEALSDIIGKANDYLVPNGLIALEHGACQGEQVQALLTKAGFTQVETRYDLAHLPRIGVGVKP